MLKYSMSSGWVAVCLALIAWCLPARAQSGMALAPQGLVHLDRGIRNSVATARAGVTPVPIAIDPLHAEQILVKAATTFPNLAADMNNADLLQRAVTDPSIRGNLRGRIAEADWINRNAKFGWKPVYSPNAPQNDAFRFVNGQVEGAQVKVHSNWREYLTSMRRDNKAEYFVLPDDHYALVHGDLEIRRQGALRGGQTAKALEYARQQKRLTKLGRNFAELDRSLGVAATHYRRISKAFRAAGKAASFIAIGMAVLDGGIAVYEVAIGKAEVDDLVARLAKISLGGAAAWWVGDAAAGAAITAGAAGATPIVVAVVVGAATYLVVDYAVNKIADSMKTAYLTHDDIERFRLVPLKTGMTYYGALSR